jgi:uncharacterized protein YyaL (SSP411 family)
VFRFSARANRAHLIEWQDWTEETFARARDEDKLLFLLVCAYWCGSCQRLDETSFSDGDLIALLNERYIPVRVEESQRPEIDVRYTQDGWPSISILTPEGDHLFSLPALGARPFIDVLSQASDSYQTKKAELLRRATSLEPKSGSSAPLNPALVGEILRMLQGLTDSENGGYGIESKFPNAAANEFFLYVYETTGERWFLDYALLTLRRMRESKMWHAEGGGGFFRYSSGRDWQQPHPEKLLDDQATLLANYLQAYLLTDEPTYRQTAEELIDYLDGTLLDEATGMFFGCQDYIRRTSGFEGVDSPLDSYLDRCLYCDQNARLASSYFQAWWMLGRNDCKERAQHVLEWSWEHLRDAAAFYHFSFEGVAQTPGLLQDCTALGLAFLDGYACTEEPQYLQRAFEIAVAIMERHRSEGGGFFDTDRLGPGGLRTRLVLPVHNGAVAAFFIRLAGLSGEPAYRHAAQWALSSFEKPHEQYGVMTAGFAQALGRIFASPVSATVVGRPGEEGVRALARAALTQLGEPDLVLRFAEDTSSSDPWIEVSSGDVTESLFEPQLVTPALLDRIR